MFLGKVVQVRDSLLSSKKNRATASAVIKAIAKQAAGYRLRDKKPMQFYQQRVQQTANGANDNSTNIMTTTTITS